MVLFMFRKGTNCCYFTTCVQIDRGENVRADVPEG